MRDSDFEGEKKNGAFEAEADGAFEAPDKAFELLKQKIEKYNPNGDFDLLKRAYDMCIEKHSGQRRVSGEPYSTHPIAVANIIADMELDVSSVAAALLHDVVEDTEVTEEDIKNEFGENIAFLVEGVTKLSQIPYHTKEEQQIESLRKMFLAMAKDVRVIVIKLADRLHNLRTMKSMPEDKQRQKARETLEVYAPLAHRLGMSKIKWELEDLSLRYIDPIGYYEIVDKISQKREEREEYIKEIIAMLEKRLGELNIKAHIEGRAKHFYSIYRKMFMQNKTIDEIYDLFAVRVIVDSVAECYAVLGMVHDLFKPMPGRFKDYIAMPKPNMYQSLHSTLIGPSGTSFEVQIRTWEMHNTAENGVAAHWKYKEGKSGRSEFDDKINWIKQLLELQKDTNAEEFMNTLKIDMFSDEVFVFTPRGDVVNLPAGSTPIDFAYAIHSAVGNKMNGAKVNGKIVTLDYKLINGDIIDIITSNSVHGPNLDWLKLAKTSQARNKINQWFKKENRAENIQKGKEILEREFKKVMLPLRFLTEEDIIVPLLKKYGFRSEEDMLATLGYGGSNAGKFLTKLKEVCRKSLPVSETQPDAVTEQLVKKTKKPNTSGVVVEGIDNCLIRLSHCCSPVPGDDIVGFVTRGRGVAVHRSSCMNVNPSSLTEEEKRRFVKVYWADSIDNDFQVNIAVTANDRVSLLADVAAVISGYKMYLYSLNSRTLKNNVAIIEMTLEIKNMEQLEKVLKALKSVDGVISVVRRKS